MDKVKLIETILLAASALVAGILSFLTSIGYIGKTESETE